MRQSASSSGSRHCFRNTDGPESDGTLAWDKTTLVLVEVHGDGNAGYDLPCLRRMLEAGAVDVLQAAATRYAGISGFLKVAALCEASGLPPSTHTAHLHAWRAVTALRPFEYFYDHVRIGSEVRFDDGNRALYATDGSNYRHVPLVWSSRAES